MTILADVKLQPSEAIVSKRPKLKSRPSQDPKPTQAHSPSRATWLVPISIGSIVVIGAALTVIIPRLMDNRVIGEPSRASIPDNQTNSELSGGSGQSETPTPSINDPDPPSAPPFEGMVWVPGGSFWMGTEDPNPMFDDARPRRLITVDGFWMDATEVTNAEFKEFVDATGYKTVAERVPTYAEVVAMMPDGVPPPPPEQVDLKAGSIVFSPPARVVSLDNHFQWWAWLDNANWRQPEGPGSSIEDRMDHPVVHVCYDDAVAYAEWAGKRLPTEAEWEFGSRGGLDSKPFAWGDELRPDGKWMANIWQGRFPNENTREDGYRTTAPVGSYPANGFGLFDMSGNVWEWCADWYRNDAYRTMPEQNPKGPDDYFDPQRPGVPVRVQRGGSYLCSDSYCVRYKSGTRGKGATDTGNPHVGFRCVVDADPSS